MYAVEFTTQVDNGSITVPEEYQERLKGRVRVLVLLEEQNAEVGFTANIPEATEELRQENLDQSAARASDSEDENVQEDFLDYLMRHPYKIPDFKPLTRDEAHERRLDG